MEEDSLCWTILEYFVAIIVGFAALYFWVLFLWVICDA
jgi:hypothetical protein